MQIPGMNPQMMKKIMKQLKAKEIDASEVVIKTSDGNLSVHARKLEGAGYIAVRKGFEDRKPKTDYRLTPKGRTALEKYLVSMESLLSEARDALEKK